MLKWVCNLLWWWSPVSWAWHAASSPPMTPVCIVKSKVTLFGLHTSHPQWDPRVSSTRGQMGEEWCQLPINPCFNIQVHIFPTFAATFVLIFQISPRFLMLISFFDAILFYSINKAVTKLYIFIKAFFPLWFFPHSLISNISVKSLFT